ncbi:MAG: hypothetical protein ACRD4V_12685 [Candidatus Acidiferrales bacterium]
MKTALAKVAVIGMSLLFFASGASSKAALSKLAISGGKLSHPVEANNSQLMQSSNPWFGKFIAAWNQADQRITNPPAGTPRYKITFYATFQPEQPPHVVYVVYYKFDSSTRQGFVYLPGPHDSEYRTNAGSIMRKNQDGRWNIADSGWCGEINKIISRPAIR